MPDNPDLLAAIRAARSAIAPLARLPSAVKDEALHLLAGRLESNGAEIIAANDQDVIGAREAGMDAAFIDRLLLTPDRLLTMAHDVRHIASLPDPIGEEFDGRRLPNGLRVCRRRVPLGVIGVIYESRPNVTIDISALCLKSGNAVLLRGGKEARRSNLILAEQVRSALRDAGAPEQAVQLVRDPDRNIIAQMVASRGAVDLIVPRGGTGLIEFVREHARVPVVAGGVGVCHAYVHAGACLSKAVEIVHNAKTRRPSVCNALDTVLIHRGIAGAFLPLLAGHWADGSVEMRCCPRALAVLEAAGSPGRRVPATEADFGQEFLSLRVALKVVDSLDDAVTHIERFGSGHSEAIIAEEWEAIEEFVDRVDAAAVLVNASTGFNDGGQLGLGAELGISTQKFHARGPLGLREMTSYKWVILGAGQTRA